MRHKEPFFLEISINHEVLESYNHLHDGVELKQDLSYYLWLISKINLPKNGKFLDIACGTCELINMVTKRGLFATGIDFSKTALINGKNDNNNIVQGNGERLPFTDNYFDVVANIGSLEHFRNPDSGASEIARVLHPNGQAYVLVPNIYSLLMNIWHAYRWGKTAVDNQPIQRYGSRMDWINLLEKNGLSVIDTIKYERHWPRTKSDWIFYFNNPKAMIRLLVTPIVPLNLAFCFLFVCKKTR